MRGVPQLMLARTLGVDELNVERLADVTIVYVRLGETWVSERLYVSDLEGNPRAPADVLAGKLRRLAERLRLQVRRESSDMWGATINRIQQEMASAYGVPYEIPKSPDPETRMCPRCLGYKGYGDIVTGWSPCDRCDGAGTVARDERQFESRFEAIAAELDES